MKIFDFYFKDKRINVEHPMEDSLLYKDNIFAVADGITRDPLNILDFENHSKEELLANYPQASPAKFAADKFTECFVDFLKDNSSTNNIKEAFINSNNQIKNLNEKNNPNPDYLINDYWACVASGGVIKDNIMHWGCIGDCGIIVYDNNLNKKFETPNSVLDFKEYFHVHNNKPKDYNWSKPESRVLVRKFFRNNPNKIVSGKRVSYGAVTGEKNAEFFMDFGEINLNPNDLILFYSDGFYPVIKEEGFLKVILEFLVNQDTKIIDEYLNYLISKNKEEFGTEKSLILVVI